jgi:hypothetical protein
MAKYRRFYACAAVFFKEKQLTSFTSCPVSVKANYVHDYNYVPVLQHMKIYGYKIKT